MTRELFIHHVEAVQGVLRRFLTALCCGDSQLADDIAQETLIKAYLSSQGLDSPEKFRAWVLRIAHNTFLNHRRALRPTEGYEEAAEVASASSSDDVFRYQALYDALALIPPRERTAILLFYMEGYAVREIAEITGSSADAVRQQLSRGRLHLRNLMKDSENEK